MNIEYGFQCPSNQQFIHRQSFLDYANRRHVDRPDSMNIDAKYITPINSPEQLPTATIVAINCPMTQMSSRSSFGHTLTLIQARLNAHHRPLSFRPVPLFNSLLRKSGLISSCSPPRLQSQLACKDSSSLVSLGQIISSQICFA